MKCFFGHKWSDWDYYESAAYINPYRKCLRCNRHQEGEWINNNGPIDVAYVSKEEKMKIMERLKGYPKKMP